MKVLAIETSTKYLNVALAHNDKILADAFERQELCHADLMIPTIDKLLKKCGLEIKDIDGLAVSIGPGSFTGLRIGVATCKGINLALGIPIVAIPTLDVIAYNFINEKEKVLCPLLDGKKGKVYTSFYEVRQDRLCRLEDYLLLDIESFMRKVNRPFLVFGDAPLLYAEQCRKNGLITISTKDWFPKAAHVAKFGLEKLEKRQFADPDKLVPMYLHSQYCQVKGYD